MTVDQILSIDRFLDPGITADALSKKTTLGGTGPNIAVSAARLGCPTALCAFVGPDFPAKYMEFMESSGLIMDEVVTLDGERRPRPASSSTTAIWSPGSSSTRGPRATRKGPA